MVCDTLVFFYAPTGGSDPGIYGWAVLEKHEALSRTLYFIPAAPTDHLKMDPWWNEKTVKPLVDRIRGSVKQGTLFVVAEDATHQIREGIRLWLAGRS